MATIAVQDLVRNGAIAEATFTAAAASDVFDNDGNTIVIVNNEDVGDKTIAVTPEGSPGALTTEAAAAISCNGNEMTILGPFDRDKYSDSNGQVEITPSATTTLSYAVLRLPILR